MEKRRHALNMPQFAEHPKRRHVTCGFLLRLALVRFLLATGLAFDFGNSLALTC
jgi:hypothetical protein